MRSLETTSGDLETTPSLAHGNECGIVARGYSNCWRFRQLWKLQQLLEAVATAGSCGWVAGKACNMTENALSILIIFSVQLQQTETSD